MMSSAYLLALLSLELLRAQSCQHDAVQITCTDNVTTLNSLFDGDFAADSTVCVNLQPNSSETLSYTDTPLHFSVVVIGSDSNVKCEESPMNIDVDDLSKYTHFPLHFHNASYVMIAGIHFHDCKRPLQFEWVESIVISSSSFM